MQGHIVGFETHDNGEHVYLSTACGHAQNDYAADSLIARKLHLDCQQNWQRIDGTPKMPAHCKWCKSPCICPCHQPPQAAYLVAEQAA